MADLQDLLARVEAAEGEDWQVRDCVLEVAEALLPRGGDASAAFARRRELIASIEAGSRLDAALALVERVDGGLYWRVERRLPADGEPRDRAEHPFWATCGLRSEQESATGATPALALLAAMIRALLAQTPQPEEGK